MAETQDCLFDLVLDDQEHSADWLRLGEVLAAVTASAKPVQGCDSTPLGALRYIATASPKFVRRHFSEGLDNEALARAPRLTFNSKDRLQTQVTDAVDTAGIRNGDRIPKPLAALVPGVHRCRPGRPRLGNEPRAVGRRTLARRPPGCFGPGSAAGYLSVLAAKPHRKQHSGGHHTRSSQHGARYAAATVML